MCGTSPPPHPENSTYFIFFKERKRLQRTTINYILLSFKIEGTYFPNNSAWFHRWFERWNSGKLLWEVCFCYMMAGLAYAYYLSLFSFLSHSWKDLEGYIRGKHTQLTAITSGIMCVLLENLLSRFERSRNYSNLLELN